MNQTASNYTEKMSPLFVHTFIFWYVSIIIVGGLANLCVLTAFFNVVKLRTKVNYFLVSLAFSDLTLQFAFLPIDLDWFIRKTFMHSVTVCEFAYTMHFLIMSCSCLNLMAVSGYRYLTICHPFVSKRITKKQVIAAVAVIWLYSTLTALLPLMGWRSKPTSVEGKTCVYSYKTEYGLFTIGVNWFFPALTVFVIYGLIFRIARIQAEKIAKNEIVLEQTDKKRRSYLLKGAISLAKIFAVYVICWLPYIINSFLNHIPIIPFDKIAVPLEYHYCMVLLSYSNTAINPFLYAGLCEDFNIAFKRYYHRLSQALRSLFESARHALRNSVSRQSSSSSHQSTALESPVRYTNGESGSSTYHQVITIVSSTTV